MHILRSERLGVLWLGAGFLACLGVEVWGVMHPHEVEPLHTEDLLFALGEMPGSSAPFKEGQTDVSHVTAPSSAAKPRFETVTEDVWVNALDSGGWVALGLSPRQARGAVRYAKSLGGIRNMEQLRRMKMLPSGWLDHYAGHVRFPPPEMPASKPRDNADPPPADASSRPKERRLLDINRADSLELLALRGVGPWVAGQILGARKRWGGIAELALLTPALNGWDSLAKALAPSFSCRREDVRVRCSDTLTIEAWRTLPRIGFKEAQALEKMARHHPGDLEALMRHPALDSSQQRVLQLYVVPCGGPE